MRTITTAIFIITLFSIKSVSQNTIADSTIIRYFTNRKVYKGRPNRYYFIEDSVFFRNKIKGIKKAKFLKNGKEVFYKCSCYSKCLVIKIFSNGNLISDSLTVKEIVLETVSPIKKDYFVMQGYYYFYLYYDKNDILQKIAFVNYWGVENELWNFSQ